MKTTNRRLSMAIGAAMTASLAAAPAAQAESVNPFGMTELASGYMLGADDPPARRDDDAKDDEGRCGEGRCGEGSCGEDHDHDHDDADADDDADKDDEGRCGEGRCGEGRCGGDA